MLPLLQMASQVAEIRTVDTQASSVGDAVSRGQQSRVSADEDGSAPTPSPHGWDSAWGKNPFSFEFHAGIAMPLGAAGIMASYSFVPWVALACGAGTNFVGPQFACMARGRLILRETRALYFGAGLSGGPHEQTEITRLGAFGPLLAPLTQMREDLSPAPLHWDFARWVNFEVGYESRKAVLFSTYAGVAFLTNPGDMWASAGTQYSTKSLTPVQSMVYAGISLGVSR
jgi:hypothetical protein